MRVSLKDYCEQQGRRDLLNQWDVKANLPLTPETVTSGSSRSIWWICDKGHTWQATPYARTANRTGCPVWAGKKVVPLENDLATRCPEVASGWNDSKNGDLHPETVSPNSHRKVWWKCKKCGYEWIAEIKSRAGINKSGCPCCSGKIVVTGTNDLAAKYPQLVSEWHPSRNGSLRPEDVAVYSNKKVWWICKEGHEYAAVISRRVSGSGCPYCGTGRC